jgi:hypothetical protein
MTKAVRWSAQQLADYDRRRLLDKPVKSPQSVIQAALVGKQATEVRPKYRSTWEEAYAMRLTILKAAGEIDDWEYETITLNLPGGVKYTPDFVVWWSCYEPVQFHEVKGRMRDSARIKLRTAIDVFDRFNFFIVGEDMVPRHLLYPDDVPATTRSRK